MKRIKFYITGGLSEGDIGKMWEGALHLIEKLGLKVPHRGIRKIISDFEGVKINGDIVRFKPDLVAKALLHQDYSDFPKNLSVENPGIVAGAYIKNVLDPKAGKIRPATTQDLIDYTKLCEAYGFYGPPCVRPNDAPVELQRILMYKISYEYSRLHAHGILDVAGWLNPKEARYGKEIADVAGKDFRIDLWLISPFLAPEEGLNILYEFKDDPVDMRYVSFVYGSAEDLIGTLYQAQLNDFFGIPLVAKSLLTTAKHPDAHAAAEKAAHTLATTLIGAYVFANAGLLSVDEIYSIQQLLIDYEIVRYCQRVARGNDFDEDLMGVELIEEIGHSGTFLDHDTTYKDFRKCLWDPEIFIHSTLRQWQDHGSKTPAAPQGEIAQQKIKDHEYRVDAQLRKELDKIYERAARELCS